MAVSGPAGNDGETGRRTTASSSQRSEVGSEHGEERRGGEDGSAVGDWIFLGGELFYCARPNPTNGFWICHRAVGDSLNTSLLYLLIAATKHDVEANQKRGRTTPSAAPASPFPLIQQPINQSS